MNMVNNSSSSWCLWGDSSLSAENSSLAGYMLLQEKRRKTLRGVAEMLQESGDLGESSPY
jgi:hypothetical protein